MRGFPQRYLVYDTETRSRAGSREGDRELSFRLGVAVYHDLRVPGCDHPTWLGFTRLQDFHEYLDVLELTRDPIYIFAHNQGFDSRIAGFFRELAAGRYSILPPPGTPRGGSFREPLMILDSPPFLVRLFRPDGQQLILCDTFNWLDVSLKQIGEWLGCLKADMPPADAPSSVWLEYCRLDVELTDLALQRLWSFWRDLGMMSWELTRASGAMHLWRARYGKRRIVQPKNHDVFILDRHAYYGGRTEAFRLGRIEGPIYQVDVTSMYPYVMSENLYPCEVIEDETTKREPTDGAPPHPCQTTAEVWLDAREHAYPVRSSQGTLYCTGNVRTILSGPELAMACKRGHVRKTGRYVRFRMSRLFKDFVHDLWSLRLAAKVKHDTVTDWLCKMLMNALYGKFGQRGGQWVTHGQDYPASLFAHGMLIGGDPESDIESRIIAGVFATRERDELARGTFVPVAAYVTSYARVYMDVLREIVGSEECFYQATDSLLVSELGRDRLYSHDLIADATLGALRLEGDSKWVDIKALGWVERPGRSIKPGLSGKAACVTGDLYVQDKWASASASIPAGRVSSISIRKTYIKLRETYSRMEHHGSGRLRPWDISNWDLTPEAQSRVPLPLSRQRGGERPGAAHD